MIKYILVTGILILTGLTISNAVADTAISIQYGTVVSSHTVTEASSHAGGAVVGGLLGAAISGPRRRGLKIMGSAAAGAAIQGAATGSVAQQYTVQLRNGGQAIVSTEQQEIRQGDCVSVEQGQHANIRRVSNIHCEERHKTTIPEHHESSANNCQLAKDELTKAQTDESIDHAAKKVRVLCED
jgi:outer membrane lipoprotein SlyB